MKKEYIPSIITLIRLLLIPIIVLFLVSGDRATAVILFLIAVLSDKLDGAIARKYKLQSYLGGLFDAITDGMMIIFISVALFLARLISFEVLILMFTPKIITSLISIFLYNKKYIPTIYSRLSSVFFYVALFLAMIEIYPFIFNGTLLLIYGLSGIHWGFLIKNKINQKF